MRRKKIVRDTKETQIILALEVDGTGAYEIDTGCGFFNHMMELFTRHGRFDIAIDCKGDTDVDYHHTVEDIGIALGRAFREALGDKKGIYRYGSMLLPMDEALILTAGERVRAGTGERNGTDSAHQDAGRRKHPSHH